MCLSLVLSFLKLEGTHQKVVRLQIIPNETVISKHSFLLKNTSHPRMSINVGAFFLSNT